MVKGEAGEKDEQAEEVTCKMIVGRGFGKVVEKIETKSGGGTQVRVFAEDQIRGSGSDELVQITGSFSAVRKTILFVSSCVQDSPRVDAANTNVTKPPGMLHHGNPMPESVEPFHQREFRAETLSCSGCCYAYSILELLRLDLNLVMLLLLGFLYTRSRLVVNLFGRGGYIISEMRRATGASIHVFPREQAPKCGARNDEVVQCCSDMAG